MHAAAHTWRSEEGQLGFFPFTTLVLQIKVRSSCPETGTLLTKPLYMIYISQDIVPIF